MPETLAPVLLRRKAAKLRKETGDENYQTLEELQRRPLSETLKIALLRPIIMLLTEPIVIFFSFCMSIFIVLVYYQSSPANQICRLCIVFCVCNIHLPLPLTILT